MLGKLKLINKETKEIMQLYNYEDVLYDLEEKAIIKEKLSDKNLILICGCSDDELEMRISKDMKLYPAKQNSLKLHHPCCYKSLNQQKSNSLYDSGWKRSEDNEKIKVRLGFKINPPRKTKKLKNTSKNKSYGSETKNRLSLSAFAKNLNLWTWERILKRGNKLIESREEFMKKIYGTASLILIDNLKTKNLKDMFFYRKKDISKPANTSRFVYMELNSCKRIQNSNGLAIVTARNHNGFEEKFYIDEKTFIEEKNKLKVKDKNFIFITGFVHRKPRTKQFFFHQFAMINTNSYGLYSESGYEIAFYDMLCRNNILFYKPNRKIPEYNNYIPDGIINTPNKTIFLEVFGFTTEEYLEQRQRKLEAIKNLKNTHKLIKWDAYKGAPMPNIVNII